MKDAKSCSKGQVNIGGQCQKVSNITISARRWFDRINGNTYHSVDVFANGKHIGREPFEYGYDEAYLQTAHDILEKGGLYPYKRTKKIAEVKDRFGKTRYHTQQQGINKQDSYHKFIQDMRTHRDKFVVIVTDVPRKKDL